MQKRTKVLMAGAVLAAAAAVPAIAQAGGDSDASIPGSDISQAPTTAIADAEAVEAEDSSVNDSDAPIPGSDIGRASTAAIEYLGAGRVTDTEVGDEESYYEVEVTLDDGRQVDVQLDQNFKVVSTENEAPGDDVSAGA